MIKETLYFGFIAGFLYLIVSMQYMVSSSMLDLMSILAFVLMVFMFVGLLDYMFIRRRA